MRQHYKIEKQMNRRAESAYDFLTALLIGIGLAWLLISWWSN